MWPFWVRLECRVNMHGGWWKLFLAIMLLSARVFRLIVSFAGFFNVLLGYYKFTTFLFDGI